MVYTSSWFSVSKSMDVQNTRLYQFHNLLSVTSVRRSLDAGQYWFVFLPDRVRFWTELFFYAFCDFVWYANSVFHPGAYRSIQVAKTTNDWIKCLAPFRSQPETCTGLQSSWILDSIKAIISSVGLIDLAASLLRLRVLVMSLLRSVVSLSYIVFEFSTDGWRRYSNDHSSFILLFSDFINAAIRYFWFWVGWL